MKILLICDKFIKLGISCDNDWNTYSNSRFLLDIRQRLRIFFYTLSNMGIVNSTSEVVLLNPYKNHLICINFSKKVSKATVWISIELIALNGLLEQCAPNMQNKFSHYYWQCHSHCFIEKNIVEYALCSYLNSFILNWRQYMLSTIYLVYLLK